MSGEDSLAVAGRLYTKSLAVALSRAGMLAELARAGVEFRRPVADLGCGDGLFARALREIGLLDGVDVALDYGLESLEALAVRPRLGAARGDLAALPFRSGSLGTVLCVTVLNAFEGGAEAVGRALLELRRVLRPGGTAVVVVSTPAFTAEAWPRKALLRLGLRRAAERFTRWLDRRNDHAVVRDEDAWTAAFERAACRSRRAGTCCPGGWRGGSPGSRWCAAATCRGGSGGAVSRAHKGGCRGRCCGCSAPARSAGRTGARRRCGAATRATCCWWPASRRSAPRPRRRSRLSRGRRKSGMSAVSARGGIGGSEAV